MKVLLTAAAKADLAAIGDYIRTDNPRRAATFVEELLDRCEGLGAAPLAYPLVPRLAALGVRRRVHGRYLIFYRVKPNHLEVLHILHGAQDFDALLFLDRGV